jgi:hypothetical protein
MVALTLDAWCARLGEEADAEAHEAAMARARMR